MQTDFVGNSVDVTFTLEVTRKETGQVETYQMNGYIIPQEEEKEIECQQQ